MSETKYTCPKCGNEVRELIPTNLYPTMNYCRACDEWSSASGWTTPNLASPDKEDHMKDFAEMSGGCKAKRDDIMSIEFEDQPQEIDTSTAYGFQKVIMARVDDEPVERLIDGVWQITKLYTDDIVMRSRMGDLFRIKPPAPERVPEVGDVWENVDSGLFMDNSRGLIYAKSKDKCFIAGFSKPFTEKTLIKHMKFIGKVDLSLLRGGE